MGKREVGNELPEVFEFKKEGDSIEGLYVKKKTNIGENKANLYILKVGEVKRSVWGTTVLDNKMDDVEVGDVITITYEGRDKKKNYHKFKLEVHDEEEEETLE